MLGRLLLASLGASVIFGPTLVIGAGMLLNSFATLPTATPAPTATPGRREATLDRLEGAISDALRAELAVAVDRVSCPDKSSPKFECRATVGSQTARILAVKSDDGRRVSWEMYTEVYYVADLVKQLDSLAKRKGLDATADCGEMALVFVNLGEPIPCYRIFPDGKRVQVRISATPGPVGLSGSGRYVAGSLD